VAKFRCKCKTVLRDDDPDTSLLILSRRDFDVDFDSIILFGRAIEMLKCPTCRRLWIFGNGFGNAPECYTPEDS